MDLCLTSLFLTSALHIFLSSSSPEAQGMADSASYEDLKNITIVLIIVTFFVTSYRCFARYSKKLWWHDDSVALFSTLSFIVFLIGTICLAEKSPSTRTIVTGIYLLTIGFFVSIWGARISILLTVVRITPWRLQKNILLWMVVFFVLQFAMLIAQTFWACELAYTGWKKIPGSVCIVPRSVPISMVVTTVISDFILILSPLMICRGVHIRALRFRLFFIFSVSIVTTVVSVVHAIVVMEMPDVWEVIISAVTIMVSVTVCSATVIIPAILRALGIGDPFMREDTVDPRFTDVEIARMTSTRIELGFPTTVNTDSDDSEGVTGTVGSRKGRDSVCPSAKDDQKHRLTMQASDGSFGASTAGVIPLADESDVAGSLALEVRGLPAVKKGQDVEAGVEDNSKT